MGVTVSAVAEGAQTPPLRIPGPQPNAHRLLHVDHILGALMLHLVMPDHRSPAQAVVSGRTGSGQGGPRPLFWLRPHGGPKLFLLPCTLTTPRPGVALGGKPGPQLTAPSRKTLPLVLALPTGRTMP